MILNSFAPFAVLFAGMSRQVGLVAAAGVMGSATLQEAPIEEAISDVCPVYIGT